MNHLPCDGVWHWIINAKEKEWAYKIQVPYFGKLVNVTQGIVCNGSSIRESYVFFCFFFFYKHIHYNSITKCKLWIIFSGDNHLRYKVYILSV